MRAQFEAFLKNAIGLDAPSIGAGAIDRAIAERAAACNCDTAAAYWAVLVASAKERQQLIEAVVVPETWFFRDAGAFAALVEHARSRLASAVSVCKPLRLLSAPCSTGEEPYSMAMALLDAGVEQKSFEIDAIDVSARAIEHARAGCYRRNSFRGNDQTFRNRHFEADRVRATVRDRVQLEQANLFDLAADLVDARYDAVFCRNLLIYFDRATQERAIDVLTGLLASDGILFVGPSESGLLLSHRFEPINWPMAFAFRKPQAASTKVTQKPSQLPRVPPVVPRTSVVGSAARGAASARNVDRPSGPGRPFMAAALAAAEAPSKAPVDLLQQAVQLADQGDVLAARECCERAVRTAGPSAPALYLLGLLHDAAGQAPRAIECYRRALYLDPEHQEALIHLAVLVEGEGDVAGARRYYERARRAAARGAGT